MGNTNGAKWIRRDKRLAIYLRDDMACVYCGAGVEDEGTILSLAHITPRVEGGTHHETNLVTCCSRCNSSRADRPVAEFATAVAGYVSRGVSPEAILDRIETKRYLKLKPYRDEAKRMIERRGGYGAAMDAAAG